jgi:hypothetical protein
MLITCLKLFFNKYSQDNIYKSGFGNEFYGLVWAREPRRVLGLGKKTLAFFLLFNGAGKKYPKPFLARGSEMAWGVRFSWR